MPCRSEPILSQPFRCRSAPSESFLAHAIPRNASAVEAKLVLCISRSSRAVPSLSIYVPCLCQAAGIDSMPMRFMVSRSRCDTMQLLAHQRSAGAVHEFAYLRLRTSLLRRRIAIHFIGPLLHSWAIHHYSFAEHFFAKPMPLLAIPTRLCSTLCNQRPCASLRRTANPWRCRFSLFSTKHLVTLLRHGD